MATRKNHGNPDGELLTADLKTTCPYCGDEEIWALADRGEKEKFKRWKLYATSEGGVCKKANYWLSINMKTNRLSKDSDGSALNRDRPELFDIVTAYAAGEDATAETLAPDEEADPYGERVQNQNRVTPLQGWNRYVLHLRLNASQKIRFIGWGPEYTIDPDSAFGKRARNGMRDINAMHGLKTTDADFELVNNALATPRRDPVYATVAGAPTEEELAKVELPVEPLSELESALSATWCTYFDVPLAVPSKIEEAAAQIRKAAGLDASIGPDIIAQAAEHRPYSCEWAAGMLGVATGDGDGGGVVFEPVDEETRENLLNGDWSEHEVDNEALAALL